MKDKVEISKEKAIEIIMGFSSKNDSFYSKVERLLIEKGLIDDCPTYKEYEALINNCDLAMLELILERY